MNRNTPCPKCGAANPSTVPAEIVACNACGQWFRSPGPLRETEKYVATVCPRGVRIKSKIGGTPKSRVVSKDTWLTLAAMSDREFDGTVCLELGIGVWEGGEQVTNTNNSGSSFMNR